MLSGQELAHGRRQSLGLVLGDERAAVGDDLEAALWQQLREPPAVLAREDLVVLGPQDERGLVEAAQRLRRLEGVARVDRTQQALQVAAHARAAC